MYCHTPKALYNHVGGHSSTNESVKYMYEFVCEYGRNIRISADLIQTVICHIDLKHRFWVMCVHLQTACNSNWHVALYGGWKTHTLICGQVPFWHQKVLFGVCVCVCVCVCVVHAVGSKHVNQNHLDFPHLILRFYGLHGDNDHSYLYRDKQIFVSLN